MLFLSCHNVLGTKSKNLNYKQIIKKILFLSIMNSNAINLSVKIVTIDYLPQVIIMIMITTLADVELFRKYIVGK